MTKYWTATYIGLTPMTFLWGVTQVTDYLTRMHTAHLANVSKSVTKNATFPRTEGLPCLITRQLPSASSTSCWGSHYLYLSNPPSGNLLPIIPWVKSSPTFHSCWHNHGRWFASKLLWFHYQLSCAASGNIRRWSYAQHDAFAGEYIASNKEWKSF